MSWNITLTLSEILDDLYASGVTPNVENGRVVGFVGITAGELLSILENRNNFETKLASLAQQRLDQTGGN